MSLSNDLKVSYANVVRIAIPLMVGGLSFTLVNLTDTLFLSQLGTTALGGAGNAVLLFAIFVEVGMGFSTGAQIVLARRNGQRKYAAIGRLFRHTLFFLIAFSILTYFTLIWVLPEITPWFVKSNEVRFILHQYLNMRAWGIVFFFINMAFMAFFIGTTKTKIIGFVTPLTAGLNIFLDYAFIFGKFGFPNLGVPGAALASNLAEFSATVIYLFSILFIYNHKKYELFKWTGIRRKTIVKLFDIGSPVMIQHFIALLAWFSFFSIIEHLGEKELAASHIIRSIYMVLIIPVFGLGNTVNSLTGNLLGLQKPKLVITLLKKSLALGMVYCLILQPIIFLFPRKMILPFTLDEELIAMAIPSMRVVFTALFLFTVIIVGFRIISGAGKTWIGLGIESLTIVVYLVSAWYLAHIPNVELWVVWTSEFIYFGIFLILVYWYLWKGKWRESQV